MNFLDSILSSFSPKAHLAQANAVQGDLDFGPVFASLETELRWVLQSSINDKRRQAVAEDFAVGVRWLGYACVAGMIANSDSPGLPSVRCIDGLDYCVFCVPSEKISKEDQQDFADNFEQQPCSSMSRNQVLEMLELAFARWFTTTGQGKLGTMLVVQLDEIGRFMIVPRERKSGVLEAFGLPTR